VKGKAKNYARQGPQEKPRRCTGTYPADGVHGIQNGSTIPTTPQNIVTPKIVEKVVYIFFPIKQTTQPATRHHRYDDWFLPSGS